MKTVSCCVIVQDLAEFRAEFSRWDPKGKWGDSEEAGEEIASIAEELVTSLVEKVVASLEGGGVVNSLETAGMGEVVTNEEEATVNDECITPNAQLQDQVAHTSLFPRLDNCTFFNRNFDASKVTTIEKQPRSVWKWQPQNASTEPTYFQPIRKVFQKSNGPMIVVVGPKRSGKRVEDVPSPVITTVSKSTSASSRMIVVHHEKKGNTQNNDYDVEHMSMDLLNSTLQERAREQDRQDASICSSKGKSQNKVYTYS